MKSASAGEAPLGSSCTLNGKWITSVAAIVAPQTCTLVRDAWVLVTPARPVALRILDSMLRLAARLLPVLLGFVLLQLCKAVFGPISNLRTSNFLRNRLGDCSLFDPPMQSGAMNSK